MLKGNLRAPFKDGITLKNTDYHNLAKLKTSNMQSAMISNRFLLGIVAFSVSFGLSSVLMRALDKSLLVGAINLPATYAAALFVDKRRRNAEMIILSSLHNKIKEMEGLKSRIVLEINQAEAHRNLLYTESNKLQNQLAENRNQRDSINRDLSSYIGKKKHLEAELSRLHNEINGLEKSKVELNQSFSVITAEKRRLELNCNVSRSEITQLQTQISELQQQKQDSENNLTLLNRLKPQLEEKLYELRVQIQELETQETEQNQLLLAKKAEKENIETTLTALQAQIGEQQAELKQLQEQFSLLQEERDQLQNQVWELLQQLENLSQEQLDEDWQEDDAELFPFSDLIEAFAPIDNKAKRPENLSEEWNQFMEQLPSYEIQVLKAIVEQEHPNAAIKKIAEENITMPTLLIDSINERASDIIGELIIESDSEPPEISQEHIANVKKVIAKYEDRIHRQASSN